jgi:hypothetical protein
MQHLPQAGSAVAGPPRNQLTLVLYQQMRHAAFHIYQESR